MTLENIEVIAPNLKRRLSGVTATIARLLPVQAQSIAIVATGSGLPAHVPCVPLWSVIRMSGRKRRVWHARRNTEMLIGLILRHVLRKRLKLVFTSASQRNHTRYTRLLISGMDTVVATSRRSASYLRRPSQVILHGIDTGTFRPTADRRAHRRSLGLFESFTIGCFGRIRHQKGTDVFVDAMLEVLPHHSDVNALVMGRATEQHEPFLHSLREEGGTGRARRPDPVPAGSAGGRHAALVSGTRSVRGPTASGGLWRHSARSHGCGVPVIATTVGAFDKLVLEGRTGRLIPPGDVVQMRAAVGTALASLDTLRQWSAAARRHVEEGFRIEDEAAALNTLYRKLLDGHEEES